MRERALILAVSFTQLTFALLNINMKQMYYFRLSANS